MAPPHQKGTMPPYKSVLCRNYPNCGYGDKCQFAHGEDDLRVDTDRGQKTWRSIHHDEQQQPPVHSQHPKPLGYAPHHPAANWRGSSAAAAPPGSAFAERISGSWRGSSDSWGSGNNNAAAAGAAGGYRDSWGSAGPAAAGLGAGSYREMHGAPRPVFVVKDHLYKTQLCRHWKLSGSCTHGEACLFAHGVEDLRAVSDAPAAAAAAPPPPPAPAGPPRTPRDERDAERMVFKAMEEGDDAALEVALRYLAVPGGKEEQASNGGSSKVAAGSWVDDDVEQEDDGGWMDAATRSGRARTQAQAQAQGSSSSSSRGQGEPRHGDGDGPLLLPRRLLEKFVTLAAITHADVRVLRRVLALWKREATGCCWTALLSAGPAMQPPPPPPAAKGGKGKGKAAAPAGPIEAEEEASHRCVLLHDLVRQALSGEQPVESVLEVAREVLAARRGAVLDVDAEGALPIDVALKAWCMSGAGSLELIQELAPLTHLRSDKACSAQERSIYCALELSVEPERGQPLDVTKLPGSFLVGQTKRFYSGVQGEKEAEEEEERARQEAQEAQRQQLVAAAAAAAQAQQQRLREQLALKKQQAAAAAAGQSHTTVSTSSASAPAASAASAPAAGSYAPPPPPPPHTPAPYGTAAPHPQTSMLTDPAILLAIPKLMQQPPSPPPPQQQQQQQQQANGHTHLAHAPPAPAPPPPPPYPTAVPAGAAAAGRPPGFPPSPTAAPPVAAPPPVLTPTIIRPVISTIRVPKPPAPGEPDQAHGQAAAPAAAAAAAAPAVTVSRSPA